MKIILLLKKMKIILLDYKIGQWDYSIEIKIEVRKEANKNVREKSMTVIERRRKCRVIKEKL